jgi:hypothetical protein
LLGTSQNSKRWNSFFGETRELLDFNPVLFRYRDGFETYTRLRKLLMTHLPFSLPAFDESSWFKDIQHCDYLVLSFNNFFKSTVRKIQRRYPNLLVYYWCNDIGNTRRKYQFIIWAKKRGVKFLCFDPLLAKELELIYVNNFISFLTLDGVLANKINSDAIFIGQDKGRLNILVDLQKNLRQYNQNLLLMIPKTDQIANPIGEINFLDGLITYEEYISLFKNSKIIVDILLDGQSGSTLRPIEASYLNKKMITNNHLIKNEDYYSPENIFVLGVDQDLASFLQAPFKKIEIDKLQKYDVHDWLTEVGKLVHHTDI